MTYCNAGHNPPILFNGASDPRRLDQGGGILGVFDHWQYEDGEVRLREGDRILMYTDGITENRNSSGEADVSVGPSHQGGRITTTSVSLCDRAVLFRGYTAKFETGERILKSKSLPETPPSRR